MKKSSLMITIATLAMALTTIPSSAQFARLAVPGKPNYPQASPDSPHSCADEMGHMRRVYQADIADIESWQQVVLIPVCDDQTMVSRTSYGSLFVEGNVGRLRMPIARNSTLMSALRAMDYDQFDVVSLGFGANDSILLYVHQRDMR
ncbi:hypothetical protein PSQ19_00250 [Devosia algicola]|uniref:Uncharacterized protein n=1 Tax=Devosia algicola TaxID=3026418 RepID=A0ABY7YNH9_9HYPH|nr:hypothetical protein [Devosia algicola]WDR02713.1 hypothetical protein PSQ19_00250 [Devosia algicola]